MIHLNESIWPPANRVGGLSDVLAFVRWFVRPPLAFQRRRRTEVGRRSLWAVGNLVTLIFGFAGQAVCGSRRWQIWDRFLG